MDIARERGLGHVETAARQPAPQLVLAGDGFRPHQLPDRAVPFLFAHTQLTDEKMAASR
jgi:hypothetical protein